MTNFDLSWINDGKYSLENQYCVRQQNTVSQYTVCYDLHVRSIELIFALIFIALFHACKVLQNYKSKREVRLHFLFYSKK